MVKENIYPVKDFMDDWETSYYEEQGQSFVLAQPKGVQYEKPLCKEGPFCSLSRNGRYLMPLNYHCERRFVTTFTQTSEMLAKQRRSIHFKDGDIVVASFPRSGTTWLEQIVLLLLAHGDPSDLNTANKNVYNPLKPERKGKIFIDILFHGKEHEEDVGKPWGSHVGQAIIMTPEQVEKVPSPRVFKSHMHPFVLPGFGKFSDASMMKAPSLDKLKKGSVKIIYAMRDPKDVVVSMYRVHLCDMENKHGMPFTAYVKLFLQGNNTCGGKWNDFTSEWIRLEKEFPDKVMIMTYEENTENPRGAMEKVADFLNLKLTHDEFEKCQTYSSFDQMKEMSKLSKSEHVHYGKVGGWKERMSNEMVQAFNDLVSDPALGEYGRRYITEMK